MKTFSLKIFSRSIKILTEDGDDVGLHFSFTKSRIFRVARDSLGLIVGSDGDAGVGGGQPASVRGHGGHVEGS